MFPSSSPFQEIITTHHVDRGSSLTTVQGTIPSTLLYAVMYTLVGTFWTLTLSESFLFFRHSEIASWPLNNQGSHRQYARRHYTQLSVTP
jgi:hypothetical protein